MIYIAYFSTRWRVNFSFLTFDLPIFQNSKLRRRKLYNFSLGYQIEMICNLLEDYSHNPSSTRLTDSTFSDFSANSLTFCCQESSSFMFSDVNIALTFGQKPEASYDPWSSFRDPELFTFWFLFVFVFFARDCYYMNQPQNVRTNPCNCIRDNPNSPCSHTLPIHRFEEPPADDPQPRYPCGTCQRNISKAR